MNVSLKFGLTSNYRLGISFTLTKNDISVSFNASLGKYYSIASSYSITWTNITRSLSIIFLCPLLSIYASLVFEFSISHLATALIAVACVYAPYLSPIAKSLYSKSSSAVQSIVKGLVYGMKLLLA